MKPLTVGSFVEICRAQGVGEVCVVVNTSPLELRSATVRERFLLLWRRGRVKSGEMASACDAIHAIERAMAKAKA